MNLLNKILDFIFPKKCFACKKAGVFFCNTCLFDLPAPRPEKLSKNRILIAGAYYKNPAVRRAVRWMKYHGVRSLALTFGHFLARRAALYIDGHRASVIVIPIPLSKKRLRRRGFNQAELIARQFAKELKLKIDSKALVKIKHTAPQADIKDEKKRLKSQKGAFKVVDKNAVRGKTIILIDDVYTTGATIKEASRALKRAGALRVIAAVVAKG